MDKNKQLETNLPLLKSCSAKQPNSLCLQLLQAKELRINPLPMVDSKTNAINAINNLILKLRISRTTPVTKGTSETIRSGIILFQLIFLSQNLAESPFLKNKALKLPLPNAHLFPQ